MDQLRTGNKTYLENHFDWVSAIQVNPNPEDYLTNIKNI